MRIIGCDLHRRQQTVAMLDTTTGEVVEQTPDTKPVRCRSFIPRFQTRCAWESKPQDRCSGL